MDLTVDRFAENPLSSLPDSGIPQTPDAAPGESPYDTWLPAPNAEEYSEAANFQPPPYLLSFVKQLLSMDIYGKQSDTVDWGAEVDYSGYEWFKDPPARPEVNSQVCRPSVSTLTRSVIGTTSAHYGQLRPATRRDCTE